MGWGGGEGGGANGLDRSKLRNVTGGQALLHPFLAGKYLKSASFDQAFKT